MKRLSKTVRIPRAKIAAALELVAPKILYDRCTYCGGGIQRSSPPFVMHHPKCAAMRRFLAVQELLQP